MKKLFTLLAALSLSGCAALPALMGVPVSPAAVADRTVLDERIAISVETAYSAAAEAATVAIRANLVSADQARRIADLDNQAYAAVQATRRAYDAGNATSYSQAAGQALPLVRQLVALVRERNAS